MTTLIIGANGATGRLLVAELLKRSEDVKIVVRSIDSIPEAVRDHPNLTAIQASILDLNDTEMATLVDGCEAVVSCLGHNTTFQGLFGHPRRLVTDATRRLCRAIRSNDANALTKFILMNTTGNRNHDLQEQTSFGQKCVMAVLRSVLPPVSDNENAADYLRTQVGQNDPSITWAAVRPDGLIDEADVTDYKIHHSPIRSAIFDAGKTSRINVANFMAQLIHDGQTWAAWQGKMPVIYNKAWS
jgi:nucleoside-diphosphate-sugar epimerase